MALFNSRLRIKSMLALILACMVVLGPVVVIGWQVLEKGRAELGQAYTLNLTRLSAQKIKAPVTRELALARRFADSVLLRQWLVNEDSSEKKALFFREASGFRRDFADNNYFIINRENLAYSLNNSEKPYSRQPRYHLDPDNPDDAWFFQTMAECENFNINVNHDVHLGETRVWINVIVRNGAEKIGLAGTGLKLGAFLDEFIHTDEPGVTPMIINSQGLIQAHPDQSLISFGSGANAGKTKFSLRDLLGGGAGQENLGKAMEKARKQPGTVASLWAQLDGKRQILALSWLPELKWYVVNAVDLKAAQVIDENWITMAIAALAVMFIVLMALFGYGVDRMILRPLNRLHHSATALSRGRYDAPLPSAQNDEIGDLSRAFAVMVGKIKNHTRQLEDKVRQRTRELEEQSRLLENAKVAAEEANNAKSEVLDNVMESIHYAQTIQQAILSTELQIKQFVPECFTLWRPKDVISGDMIWSKDQEDGFAIAVIDCTGHGVPGGIMTMAAVSVLNRVVSEFGLQRPHRILQEVSRIVQNMLGNQKTCRFSEDGLDMALCTYQRSWSTLFFAGARLGLLYENDGRLLEIKGDKQSLGYRSSNPDYPFQTRTIAVEKPLRVYLATDGTFDQIAENTGLPLGKRRIRDFLTRICKDPMDAQKQSLANMMEEFQGSEEQRDDITVVGLHLKA